MFNSFATPWTVAHQAPLSMRFPRQEYWSGWPVPSPGDFPHVGIEPASPAWQVDSLLLNHQETSSKRVYNNFRSSNVFTEARFCSHFIFIKVSIAIFRILWVRDRFIYPRSSSLWSYIFKTGVKMSQTDWNQYNTIVTI